MSWDPVWEGIFASRVWGRYPHEDVVRFVARAFYPVPDRSRVRILEVGCGPGSGASWFCAREGFALSGIDASPAAIERSRARFREEGLSGEFVLGDVNALRWPDATFDAVLDVVCLACNTEEETAEIVNEIHRVLKPGGLHFSMTPKAGCWGDGVGERLDATTHAVVSEGPFAGLGKTRFATAASLQRLYSRFRDLELEYTVRSAEQGAREVTHWLLSCRK
jgi:ubiquinone/menaquinone biosynthesis C-methylase UbiE